LLLRALTHSSYANEKGTGLDNERLEFLGDAVLGMVTASLLYSDLTDQPEGELARIESVVVSEATLSQIALNIGVDKCLILGKGEELSGGRTKKAILADAMEAIIGAYYLDSGYREAEKFVLKFMIEEVEKVLKNKHQKDYKTLLQEWFQKKYKKCPRYELVETSGPDHDRVFLVQVRLDNQIFGPEKGKNKKEAEQAVAKLAYSTLCKENS
jgi:ribonuclease-3